MLEATRPTDASLTQEAVLNGIRDFSAKNPEIIEALAVMNLSMADYLQALAAIKGTETASCSPSAHVPLYLGF